MSESFLILIISLKGNIGRTGPPGPTGPPGEGLQGRKVTKRWLEGSTKVINILACKFKIWNFIFTQLE